MINNLINRLKNGEVIVYQSIVLRGCSEEISGEITDYQFEISEDKLLVYGTSALEINLKEYEAEYNWITDTYHFYKTTNTEHIVLKMYIEKNQFCVGA